MITHSLAIFLRVVPSWMTNHLKLILVLTSSNIYQSPLIGNVEMLC